MRYIGIDAPEFHPDLESFGIEVREANRQLVAGKKIRLEQDVSEKDKYGRLLRYVWADDILVEAELARQGFAQVKAYCPNIKYQDNRKQMDAEAGEARRGLWAK